MRSGGVVLCLCLHLSTLVQAQSTTPQEPEDDSGGLQGLVSRGSSLNFVIDINEARDSAIPLRAVSAVQRQDLTFGGFSTRLVAATNYARVGRVLRLSASASSAVRYLPRGIAPTLVSQSGGIGAGINVTRRASIELSQSASYSPSYLYQLLPVEPGDPLGLPAPADPEIRADRISSEAYRTTIGMTAGSATGTRFSASTGYGRVSFRGQSANRPTVNNRLGSASLSRAVSRNVMFSLGYDYQTGDLGFGGRRDMHRATLGTTLARALSLSRRATVTLSVLPSIVDTTGSTPLAASSRNYQTQASASLAYPFTFNWGLVVSYRRLVETLAILTEPITSNGASIQLSGSPARRLALSAQARYAEGRSLLAGSGGRLETYVAGVRVQQVLLQSLALYSEYQYYYYDLGGLARLAPGLPGAFKQHGVRVGAVLRVNALGR